MYKSHRNTLGTNKPVKPPVKVFVVGNPSAGKSSLTAALKKEIRGIARLFTSGKVSGIDQKTVGIVPHEVESNTFGKVTLYDFAGHREFYSGHAALLQTAIQSTPPIFLLVVNLCEEDNAVTSDAMYWISFLENQCASVNCKPHIILVGSHADMLKSSGINAKNKLKAIIDSLDTKNFINMNLVGFVAMDCQYHDSSEMSDLRRLLIKSCNELRIHEPIMFNAHCFLVYLIDTFKASTAVTINTIYDAIENQLKSPLKESILEFLPGNFEALYKICVELNDRGHILLLKDREKVENSYIVIDKAFLLSEMSGTVFAPEGFKQYTQLSTNTGVVPRSKLADSFPGKDLNIVIGFLNHLEFCHEIADQVLHQLISEQYSQAYNDKERYYLFPALISINSSDSVWKAKSHFEHNFGWSTQCVYDEQFFSSRFLQVLLLRLAFTFALKVSGSDHKHGIHRKCSIWKNGIFWGRNFNMDVLVEVAENKLVTIITRFGKANLLKCIKHRSEIIQTILECTKEFCPRIKTVESFIDSSSGMQYPLDLNADKSQCTVQDLCEALTSDCEHPSVVLSDGNSIPAEKFLAFEPYFEINDPELLDKNAENNVVSDAFIKRAESSKLSKLIVQIFGESLDTPSSRDDSVHDNDTSKQMTYKWLRQRLDPYSVFAGRNNIILDLVEQKSIHSSVTEKKSVEVEANQLPSLTVKGIIPQLCELQLVECNNGREVRIMEEVTPKWKHVAIALGFDEARIRAIEIGAHYQPDDACFKMFSDWLAGGHHLKPATWAVLIRSLKAAKLTKNYDLLSSTIKTEAENTSTSSTSTMVVDYSSSGVTSTLDVINENIKGPTNTIPSISALEVIKGRGGKKIQVIDSIGSQWDEVAKALKIKHEDIEMIKTTHSDNDEEACREMLTTWLEGNNGEVSWTAFTQALIDAGLPELADSLKTFL